MLLLFLGFSIRGIIPAFVPSARPSVSYAHEQILSVSSSKRKNAKACGSEEEEVDNEKVSSVRKTRVRRRAILDDEAHVSKDPSPGYVPFNLVDNLESVHLDISDEDVDHLYNPPSSPAIDFLPNVLRLKKILAPFFRSHHFSLFDGFNYSRC